MKKIIMGTVPFLDNSGDNIIYRNIPLTYPSEDIESVEENYKRFLDTVLPESEAWVAHENYAPVKVWIETETVETREGLTPIGLKVEKAYQKRLSDRLEEEDMLIEEWT